MSGWFEALESRVVFAGADIALAGAGIAIVANDTTPDTSDGTDFGSLNIARAAVVHTFTITNTGDAPLHLPRSGRVKFGGANKSDFTLLTKPVRVIAPGDSTSFDVRFNPGKGGDRLARLTVVSDDPDSPRFTLALRGVGLVTPEIQIEGRGETIMSGDDLPSIIDGSDFGVITVAGGSVTRTFNVRNLGSAKLTLADSRRVVIEGPGAADFEVVKQPAPTIGAGSASTFRIAFKPIAVGLRTATVRVMSNDTDEAEYTFAIQGLSPEPIPAITTERIAAGLDRPLFVTSLPGVTDRLFIVEKGSNGTAAIRILNLADNSIRPTPFLTINGIATEGEQGLLGLAFDPDYAENGRFFVDLTNGQGDTEIRRYQVSDADPNIADDSFALVLKVNQPFANHNGGWIGFGPDGFLYISMGDGGDRDDPFGNAQNKNSLLGKMLRIDVNGTSMGEYGIPAGNPFVDKAGRDEIWALGLRNAWRASFDRLTGDLWLGDVGQDEREEIDRLPAGVGGLNLGWRAREGTRDNPNVDDAPSKTRLGPVLDYPHTNGNQSVTGGNVYRGEEIAGLRGVYFYADFVSGHIWAFRTDGAVVSQRTELTDALDPDGGGSVSIDLVSSFGEDAAGNLYIVDFGGEIFRIKPTV